jgi:hypothetical protein
MCHDPNADISNDRIIIARNITNENLDCWTHVDTFDGSALFQFFSIMYQVCIEIYIII